MGSLYYTGATNGSWATTTNWNTGSAPAGADDVLFDQNGATDLLGSDQSAITLTSLTIKSTYTKAFGDLLTPLKVKATTVRIGDPSGSAVAGQFTGRLTLDLSTAASTITVVNTGNTSTDTGLEPVRIKAVNSSNKLLVLGGRVGVATNAIGDVATFGEIALLGNGTVNVSSGVTLTTWRQEAGNGNLYCGMTTLQNDAGAVNVYGSGAITTANVSGQAVLSSSGTITTLNVYGGGTADLTQSSVARTITTINLFKGATLKYGMYMTITNPIVLNGCGPNDVTIQVPNGRTVAIA